MYRYIIKNKGLYSVYAILLVVSSTMSVFFAFVLSEIMNCAAEGKLQRLMRVLIVGIVFLLVTVFSEFFYGITKNKLICKARQDLKHDLFDRILHKNVTNFESRNTGDYMNDLQNNLIFCGGNHLYIYKAIDAFTDTCDRWFYGTGCKAYWKDAGTEYRRLCRTVGILFGRN